MARGRMPMTIADTDGEIVEFPKSCQSIRNPVSVRGCDVFVEFLTEPESARAFEGLKKVGVARCLVSLAGDVLQEPPATNRAFDDAADTKFDPCGV